jgi:restriction system protein
MKLPKYHETFNAILEVLSNGEALHYNELQKRVRDKYYSNLTQDLLDQKTSTGANVLLDRIGRAKSYLKQGKLVAYPQRAMVQITEKGKKIIINGGITLQELKKDNDFLEYRKESRLKSNDKKDEENEDISIINASPQDLIDSGFATIEAQVKTDLLERLRNIDPYYFEKVILILLKKMGYGDFVETSKSGDGGIDGVINEDKLGLEKIYMQAKRYNENKVREKEIRNFIGAMSGDTTKGIFVTTSTFDDSAIKKAHEAHHKIILIDGNKLVNLMHQYGVGVQISNIYEMKEIDEDFFEGN